MCGPHCKLCNIFFHMSGQILSFMCLVYALISVIKDAVYLYVYTCWHVLLTHLVNKNINKSINATIYMNYKTIVMRFSTKK